MKKHRPRPKKQKKKHDGLFVAKHPFSGIDPKLVREAVRNMAIKKSEEFPGLLDKLLKKFRAKNPLHLIAVVSAYGLSAGVTDQGVQKRHSPKIEQHHVELMQAILLSIPEQELSFSAASPHDVQEIIDTLPPLAEAFQQRRLVEIANEMDLEERTAAGLQERLRLHTQVVRNWGYFSQVIEISTELYSALDKPFEKALGFSASDLISVAQHIVKALEARQNERWKRLRIIFKERSIRQMVRRYYAAQPGIEGDPEDFIKEIPAGTPPEAVFSRLMAHSDIELPRMALFLPKEIAAETSLSEEKITAMLNAIALPPGGLEGENIEHFFLSNPIWRTPFIKLGNSFFCSIPQSFFSHIHEVMKGLADKAGLKEALETRRSEYLETKVAALLRRTLPKARLLSNIKWRIGAQEFETDHLTIVDRTVLIIEDKSAALSGPGLRGAPDRLKRHIRDLVFAPSEQSARLEALIMSAKSGDTNAQQSLAHLDIDVSKVDQVARISVTLDDFSMICSAEDELKDAGWIPKELELATTLNIADFQLVSEILPADYYFLHYFIERQRIQKKLHLFADEIDMLGFYLETGFNVGDMEKKKAMIALTGMSGVIDHYYNSLDAGVTLEKPAPKSSAYYKKLLDAISEVGFDKWTLAAVDLLRAASHTEQKQLERWLEKIRNNVRRKWRDPGHDCSVVLIPPEQRETAIVFHMFPQQLAAQRREHGRSLVEKGLDASGRKRCILISRNIDKWDDPYVAITIAHSIDQPEDEHPALGNSAP